MKKLQGIAVTLFFLAVFGISAQAAVQPVIITLTSSNTDYTVPATNVLIVESGYSGNAYSNATRIALISSTITNYIYVDNWFKKITPLQPPLKIPAGWTIRGVLDPSDEHFFILFGLLVSPEDLYAAIPNEFEAVAKTEEGFEALLRLANSRQPVITVDRSEDLANWIKAADARIYPERQKIDHRIVLPPNMYKEFLRTRARSRVGSGGIKKN